MGSNPTLSAILISHADRQDYEDRDPDLATGVFELLTRGRQERTRLLRLVR